MRGIKLLIDWFYPPVCPVCDQILPYQSGRNMQIHEQCMKKLIWVKTPMCMCCGKPVQNEQRAYCFDCQKRRPAFEQGHSLWIYNRECADSIYAFKYRGRKQYAVFYGQVIRAVYGKWIGSLAIDVIIPVPINPKKLIKRGYNQAEVLAKVLSRYLEIPIITDALVRLTDTAPQKNLSRSERRKNLMHAFKGNKKRLAEVKRVLLVDDIYTTGVTMNCCAEILKRMGVEKVFFITISTGVGI